MAIYPLLSRASFLYCLFALPISDGLNRQVNMAAAEANAAQSFQAALGHIGFSVQAQPVVVVAQGFISMALLSLVTAYQMKQLCKLIHENADNPVPINMLQQQILLSMWHWVVNRQRLGLPVDPDEFTAIIALSNLRLWCACKKMKILVKKKQ